MHLRFLFGQLTHCTLASSPPGKPQPYRCGKEDAFFVAPSLLAEDTLLTPLILNGKAKFLHINLRIRDLGPGVQLSGKVLMDWVVCV